MFQGEISDMYNAKCHMYEVLFEDGDKADYEEKEITRMIQLFKDNYTTAENDPSASHTESANESESDVVNLPVTTTFDIIAWIRDRRLRWVVHIMRMIKNINGEERQIKETLKVIFHNRYQGDIPMNVAEDSWEALQKTAADRDKWRTKVLGPS